MGGRLSAKPSGAGQPAPGKPPPKPPEVPDHKLLRLIGHGSYGQVWLARSALGHYRAVKVVWRDSFDHDRPFEREFQGLQRFEPISRSHESQVDVLRVGRNDQQRYFYYVMELADDANGTPIIERPSRAEPIHAPIANPESQIANPDSYLPPPSATKSTAAAAFRSKNVSRSPSHSPPPWKSSTETASSIATSNRPTSFSSVAYRNWRTLGW